MLSYITKIARNIESLKNIVPQEAYQKELHLLETLLEHKNNMLQVVEELSSGMKTATSILDLYQRGLYYSSTLLPKLQTLRSEVDALEKLSDIHTWPIPSYYDLLFNL